ncbi:hypothetical protein Q7P37_008939 [Cladosporium fusiforme]
MSVQIGGSDNAGDYNELPLIDEQRRTVDDGDLRELAALFLRHGAHDRFGLALLHRHVHINTQFVMVHSRISDDTYSCRPEKSGMRQLTPYLFSCESPTGLSALEYLVADEHEPLHMPSMTFLTELDSSLRAMKLQKVLGLSRISPQHGPWIETVLPQDQCMISTLSKSGLEGFKGIITEWSFFPHGTGDCVRNFKGCAEDRVGVHDPPVPPKPK